MWTGGDTHAYPRQLVFFVLKGSAELEKRNRLVEDWKSAELVT